MTYSSPSAMNVVNTTIAITAEQYGELVHKRGGAIDVLAASAEPPRPPKPVPAQGRGWPLVTPYDQFVKYENYDFVPVSQYRTYVLPNNRYVRVMLLSEESFDYYMIESSAADAESALTTADMKNEYRTGTCRPSIVAEKIAHDLCLPNLPFLHPRVSLW